MGKFYFALLLTSLALEVNAQTTVTGSAYIPSGGNVAVWGTFTNAGTGSITNAGTLYVHDTIDNSGATGYNGGILRLFGSGQQYLGGSQAFNTSNLYLDNPAGFLLKKEYSVGNQVTFNAGMVTAPISTEPLTFNPGGTGGVAIAPVGVTDAAHVNGYVSQKGTGAFSYPVGDATRYQPVSVNISSNTQGLLASYAEGDAGVAAFLNTGLDATVLFAYNASEYWDLHPQNSGTTVAAVTIHYDDYGNMGIGTDFLTALKVAHKTVSGWVNEGGAVSGTQTSGTVAMGTPISSWSTFTLGSISPNSPLPVGLSSLNAKAGNCVADLRWSVAPGSGIVSFAVQYSSNGRDFSTVEEIKFGNENEYSYRYAAPKGSSFYRIAIRYLNDDIKYSNIQTVDLSCDNQNIVIYPNPIVGNELHVHLSGYSDHIKAAIFDEAGRKVKDGIVLKNGVNMIRVQGLAAASYILMLNDAGTSSSYKFLVQE